MWLINAFPELSSVYFPMTLNMMAKDVAKIVLKAADDPKPFPIGIYEKVFIR